MKLKLWEFRTFFCSQCVLEDINTKVVSSPFSPVTQTLTKSHHLKKDKADWARQIFSISPRYIALSLLHKKLLDLLEVWLWKVQNDIQENRNKAAPIPGSPVSTLLIITRSLPKR